jgi:hypothetical protein
MPTEKGLSPLNWSDKCFLCGSGIGESDPRGFYQGGSAMALCHRGCLNVMDSHGGTPQDYHRAVGTDHSPPVTADPTGLDFADVAALQVYTVTHGDIPRNIKVTVAGKVIQQ